MLPDNGRHGDPHIFGRSLPGRIRFGPNYLRLANYSYGWPATVGQVGNLQRVGNPLLAVAQRPAKRRLTIGGRMPSCPTGAACRHSIMRASIIQPERPEGLYYDVSKGPTVFSLPLVKAGQGSLPHVRAFFLGPGIGPIHGPPVGEIAKSGCPNDHLIGSVRRQSAECLHQTFLILAEGSHRATIPLRRCYPEGLRAVGWPPGGWFRSRHVLGVRLILPRADIGFCGLVTFQQARLAALTERAWTPAT